MAERIYACFCEGDKDTLPPDRRCEPCRSRLGNLWGIHCVECSVELPCEACAGQIAAEHGYLAEHPYSCEED